MDRDQSTSGHKKKNKTTENTGSKKKKAKKSAKTVEAVKVEKFVDYLVTKKQNSTTKQDSAARDQPTSSHKKKNKQTKKNKKSGEVEKFVDYLVTKKNNSTTKYTTSERGIQKDRPSSTSLETQHKGKGGTKAESKSKKSNTETRDGNMSKDLNRSKNMDAKHFKALPAIESVGNDEAHPLDYNPEAVLIEAEEDLHLHDGRSRSEDIHECDGQHLADMDSDVDPALFHREDVAKPQAQSGQHISGSPNRLFREGTPGGRMFKEETLAEMDAYLYLGKVSL